MKPKSASATPATSTSSKAKALPESGSACYRDGPPDIWFAGRHWLRSVKQPISRVDFDALTSRPDAANFSFTFTGNAASAADSQLSEE